MFTLVITFADGTSSIVIPFFQLTFTLSPTFSISVPIRFFSFRAFTEISSEDTF